MMTRTCTFSSATAAALADFPKLQRYFHLMEQVQLNFPGVFKDTLFYDKSPSDITPEDIREMADNSFIPCGSYLMNFLHSIVYNLIVLQKADLLEKVLSLLTADECTELLWKTHSKVQPPLPLVFVACLVPYEHHLESLPSNKEARENGLPPILDLLLTKGGWIPTVGCTLDVHEDAYDMAELGLPQDFFGKLRIEILDLERDLQSCRKQLSPQDRRRLSIPEDDLSEDDLSEDDLSEDNVPEDQLPPVDSDRARLKALLVCQTHFEKKESFEHYGLPMNFFVQLDQEIDRLRVKLDDMEVFVPSDCFLLRELDLLESLRILCNFYSEKTRTSVNFINLMHFFKCGQKVLFDKGFCPALSGLMLGNFIADSSDSIFSFTSVLPWNKFRNYLKSQLPSS